MGNAELLAQQIPHSTIHILPGVGHFYPFEDAAGAVTAVTAFLQ
jgi:pimeloyl-ACP methyl ester carboxylesterase